MSDAPIHDLPAATTVAGTDVVPIDQGFVTRKATMQQVSEAVGPINVGVGIHNANVKTTPIDPDELGIVDTADGNTLKKLTWGNLKATLLAYFSALTGTWNISITGNAATSSLAAEATKLQTARNLDVTIFDGTANVTIVAPAIHAATNKATPVDADETGIWDSVTGLLNKVTWANIKTTLAGTFTTIASLAASGGSALIGFIQAGTGAVAQTVQSKQRESLSVFDFMTPAEKADVIAGTGLLDVTTAIKAAITAAAANKVGEIVFPYSGVYLCSSSIVAATSLPNGLHFVAKGISNGLTGETGTVIKYTGSDALCDIQEPLGVLEVGNYSWSGFTFSITNSAAKAAFRFNSTLIPPTDSAASQNYIRQISFQNCKFNGPNYIGTVPLVVANAIECTKVFELVTDARCEFRGWLTGIFLYGCDVCEVQGRFSTNVKHIHIEAVNTFGNDNTINTSNFGILNASGVTGAYAIYDDGSHTTIYNPAFEIGLGAHTAFIFFGRDGSSVFNPKFGNSDVPLFQLGASARYVNMYSPSATTPAARTPLYGIAGSVDTRGSGVWGITVHSPNAYIQVDLVPDYRLKVVDESKQWESTCTYMAGLNIAASNNGISARRGICSPLNYIGTSNDQALPPPTMVADAGGHYGKAIQTQAVNTSGFSFLLYTFKHFMPSDYLKLTVIYRYPVALSSGNHQLQTIISDAAGIDTLTIPNSATYTTLTQTISLAGFTSSDYLRVKFYNNACDVSCNVAGIFWEVVDPPNADTSGLTLGQLETEVNELKATLRRFGILG